MSVGERDGGGGGGDGRGLRGTPCASVLGSVWWWGCKLPRELLQPARDGAPSCGASRAARRGSVHVYDQVFARQPPVGLLGAEGAQVAKGAQLVAREAHGNKLIGETNGARARCADVHDELDGQRSFQLPASHRWRERQKVVVVVHEVLWAGEAVGRSPHARRTVLSFQSSRAGGGRASSSAMRIDRMVRLVCLP
jgi:hypothetical protein